MSKIVFLDAGHGGADPGSSRNGLVEKHWTLEVTKKIASILKASELTIYQTRVDDSTVELSERTSFANRVNANIFVSIHFNAGGGYGYEDFIHNSLSGQNDIKLQEIIHKNVSSITTKFGLKNRGKKQANFHVLRESKMPAVLLEAAFCDTSDYLILENPQFKEEYAVAIANSILEYFGINSTDLKINEKETQNEKKDIDTLVQEVLRGKWGNGVERRERLEAAGHNYQEIQSKVNELYGVSTQNKPSLKSNEEIVDEIWQGKWGNGAERKQRLEAAGYDYQEIQSIINGQANQKGYDPYQIADEVINGDWGNGAERKQRLEAAGYDYQEIQSIVNEKLG